MQMCLWTWQSHPVRPTSVTGCLTHCASCKLVARPGGGFRKPLPVASPSRPSSWGEEGISAIKFLLTLSLPHLRQEESKASAHASLPPHPGSICFSAWHCPLPTLYFFTSINIFMTWVSSSRTGYPGCHVTSGCGHPLPCFVEAFPLLSPAKTPNLALALAPSRTLARGVPLAPRSQWFYPPCTANGNGVLPLGVLTGPVWGPVLAAQVMPRWTAWPRRSVWPVSLR